MSRFRLVATITTMLMVSGVIVDQAVADDFWRTAARGLQFAGWRPGTGDIGVSQHVFGDGYTVQTTRLLNNFEANGGVLGFEFSDATNPITGAPLRAALNTEFLVRQWLIPTAEIRIATDLVGTDTAVPVDYHFWINTGIQDVEIKGTGSLEAKVNINALGFYDVDAFISNRGDFEIDGFLYADDGTLDYDLGPMSLSGNIYIDLFAALTAPLFSSLGVANPLAALTGRAKLRNQLDSRDALVARLEAGETLTDEEMGEILSTSIMESVFGGGGSDLLDTTQQNLASVTQSEAGGLMGISPDVVPEPASLGLWLAFAAAAASRRRNRS